MGASSTCLVGYGAFSIGLDFLEKKIKLKGKGPYEIRISLFSLIGDWFGIKKIFYLRDGLLGFEKELRISIKTRAHLHAILSFSSLSNAQGLGIPPSHTSKLLGDLFCIKE